MFQLSSLSYSLLISLASICVLSQSENEQARLSLGKVLTILLICIMYYSL